MSKKYIAFPIRHTDKTGNTFLKGFTLGLADIGCMGFRQLDLTGLPVNDSADIASDWEVIGAEMKRAIIHEEAAQKTITREPPTTKEATSSRRTKVTNRR